jgi:hypothetical protein
MPLFQIVPAKADLYVALMPQQAANPPSCRQEMLLTKAPHKFSANYVLQGELSAVSNLAWAGADSRSEAARIRLDGGPYCAEKPIRSGR